MHLMRFSILNVSAVIFFLAAVILFFFNPFDYVELELLVLPGFLTAVSLVLILLDVIIKALAKKKRSWYLFTQIFALEVVLGILFLLLF